MNARLLCIPLLLLLVLVLPAAYAVPITASVTPSSLDAGQTSQLLNFTISNNGTVGNNQNYNITQVNITLPSGFTLASSGTTTSSYTFYTNPISWTNTSSIGIVGRQGETQYFWLYVNTPSNISSVNGFNITVYDANGGYNSTNVTVSIVDTLSPKYSNNVSSPTTNSSYASGQDYWFNVTWSDGTTISAAYLEHNFTGSSTPHNESMSNSSTVFYTKFTDLAAGTYVWKVYANDSSGNANSTNQIVYNISKASNIIEVYLNSTLNGNLTSVNSTGVNITTNTSCSQSGCTRNITLDNVTFLVSSNANPLQYTSILTTIGLHNYTIGAVGNVNFTHNSSTYFVATVPSYTIATGLPLTWTGTSRDTINVTFIADPLLQNISLLGDWTGSYANHSMQNSTGSAFSYNLTSIPAGTHRYKLFGVYANHTFNLTDFTNFTINKASATLTLSIAPQWSLDSPVKTNVSCTVNIAALTVNLFRNGTGVSNPDVQTFKAGDIYTYLCNATGNQNYTDASTTNTLKISKTPSTTLSFIDYPSIIQIVQNSSTVSAIAIKNTGGVDQDVTLSISGIDKDWYTPQQQTSKIIAGLNGTFTVSFSIPNNVEVKDYAAVLIAQSVNGTVTANFTVRILPNAATKVRIIDSLNITRIDLLKLKEDYNEIKEKGINISNEVETKLAEMETALNQADAYINVGDYFNAYLTINKAKALGEEISSDLRTATGISIPADVWKIILGVVIVGAIGFVAYLLWPTKAGYTPQKGYTEGKSKLVDKMKNNFTNRGE